ncbi:hypothetical protein SRHO_G00070350 [Serrasalmus rhombeus]
MLIQQNTAALSLCLRSVDDFHLTNTSCANSYFKPERQAADAKRTNAGQSPQKRVNMPDWLRECVRSVVFECKFALPSAGDRGVYSMGCGEAYEACRLACVSVCACVRSPTTLARGHLEAIREIIYGRSEVTTQKCRLQENASQLPQTWGWPPPAAIPRLEAFSGALNQHDRLAGLPLI